jgi:PAS domain S-box-containing protein
VPRRAALHDLLHPRSRGVVAAVGLLAIVTIVDLAVGTDVVLVPLLVVGPLVAAVRCGAPAVAGVGAIAIALAILLVLPEGGLDDADNLTAVAAVAAGSVLAVAVAQARDRLAGTARQRGAALAAERVARRRADLLAQAGGLLESSTDPDGALAQIADLAIPELGDVGVVDVLDAEGRLRVTVTSAVAPEIADKIRRSRERYPLDMDGPHAVPTALRTGEAQLLPTMPDELLVSLARDEEHLELLRSARYRSAIAVPLVARGRALGVLSWMRVRDERPYDEDDLQLGRELAQRAALALDNARLFSEVKATEGRLERIVANLGEAVTAMAPDGTFVFANQAAAELVGFSSPAELLQAAPGELIGNYNLLDERAVPIPRETLPFVHALRGERPEPMLVRTVDPADGSDRWFVSRADPILGADGTVELVVAVTEDVTAVKRAEARERLLSSASKLLIAAYDVETTAEKAAWAAVPELADWARVDMTDERGVLREVAVAHRDLPKAEILREWRREFPPAEADGLGPWEVLRTGRSVVWDHVDPEDVERYAQSPRHRDFMRAIDTRSVLIVPLTAGERVIGTLQLATTGDSGRLLGAADVELAEELARRAALAIENARVHAARTHIASTLQRSLLPPRLPVVPGLTIAARFRAAGTATEVGGDFYDLFQGRSGWMVVVGDVTGKGPSAAAITSLARYTMRTAAMYEDRAHAMLERLNATLGADPDRRQICTAVCVGVRPDEASGGVRLEVVCAGHPSPLLITADGAVRQVGEPGTLLGAFPEGHWTAEDLDLAPGETLVLYTDGVTDTRGRDGRFGVNRLIAVLEQLGSREPDDVAQGIDDALQAFGEQRDDVALLVLQADAHRAPQASVVAASAATGG